MARKRANLTDLLNQNTFRCLYDRYRLIAVNAWEWDGLPDGIQARHIERVLFERGMVAFFRAPQMGFMALECEAGGNLNVYGDPLWYRAHGHNYHVTLNEDDCVIIENNLLRLPTNPFIMHYVNKLAEAERTMDVNIKACKTPIVFACDDKDALTFKRIFQQVDGNVPAFFADRALNLESIQAFQTGAKFMGNELMDYKRAVESDVLTFLGENNTPVDKKERVLNAEANANNGLIEAFSQLQDEARQRAVKAINEKYGLSITVKRRVTPVENPVEPVEEGE